jgi:hypothetical protein
MKNISKFVSEKLAKQSMTIRQSGNAEKRSFCIESTYPKFSYFYGKNKKNTVCL